MAIGNFSASLAFVWQAGFDDPKDGCHTTVGDPGGATYGGVIEVTWAAAVRAGIVAPGALANATMAQLSSVLKAFCWGDVCDALPSGLDLLMFNGRMMSGHYAWMFQQCLGLMGSALDGSIGPETIARAQACHAETLINALSGCHDAYLASLGTWSRFGHGWTTRIEAAQQAALGLARQSLATVS